jgi:hypothetical protein
MRLFLIIFFCVGMAMSAVDVYLVRSSVDFASRAAVADGEVIGYASSRGSKGGTLYAPRVRYAVPLPEGGAGRSYEIVGSVSSSSRSYDEGDHVPVMYLPDRPAEGRIKSFMEQWFGPLIVSVFALVFNAIWIGFAVAMVRKRRMHAWLEQNGMPVEAKVVDVRRNTSVKVNGRSPRVIEAQWQHPMTREVHSFESENIWFDPSEFVEEGRMLKVRVDADDPRRHRVDLGFLPKKG